jgi:ubiquinone/menaquinone biosynthesis C-methylase UbiE
MNYSLFIKQLKNDTNEMWLETLESKDEFSCKRAFDDEVEKEFWKDYSEEYDKKPSLYEYCPETLDKIIDIIGKNKKVIEFGAGTGQFTIPMAKNQKNIIAVDFSCDMINKLEQKMGEINNIELVHGKIEDVSSYKAQAIYGVNCIYRIQDMKQAITKMMNMASEKILFVWTMQRNKYDSITNSTDKKGILRKQEYIHIINLLYDMGIDCNLEIMKVNKNIVIENIEDNYKELLEISNEYNMDYNFLKREFEKKVFKDVKLYYKCELKVAYIYFETN